MGVQIGTEYATLTSATVLEPAGHAAFHFFDWVDIRTLQPHNAAQDIVNRSPREIQHVDKRKRDHFASRCPSLQGRGIIRTPIKHRSNHNEENADPFEWEQGDFQKGLYSLKDQIDAPTRSAPLALSTELEGAGDGV